MSGGRNSLEVNVKKKVKKKIKQDKFIDLVTRAIQFVSKRKKIVLYAATGILVIALVVLGGRLLKSGKASGQNRVLTQILELDKSMRDNPDQVTELESLAGKGKFARMAYLKLAAYWMEQKDFAKAEAEIMMFPKNRKDLLYFQSRDMYGQVLKRQKKYAEALAVYDALLAKPDSYAADVLYFHKAEILEEQGEVEKALELYQKVEADFQQTYYGYEAAQKVKTLEEKK